MVNAPDEVLPWRYLSAEVVRPVIMFGFGGSAVGRSNSHREFLIGEII